MADLPIFNNIKDRFIPSQRDDDEEVFDDENEDTESGELDVLAQFRIEPYTELDEEVLTPSRLRKVQFNESRPKGFSMKQVEAFHTKVTKSISWYIKALERRDKDVHKLATEVDKYKTDLQNMRFQLEMLQGVGGKAMVDDSGEYIKESQISDDERRMVEIENENEQLKEELRYQKKLTSDLEREASEKPATPQPAPVALPSVASNAEQAELTDDEYAELQDFRERQVELDEWEQEVIKEYSRLEQELEEAKNALENAGSDNGATTELQQQINELNESLTQVSEERDRIQSELSTVEQKLNDAVSERDNAMREREESVGERDSLAKQLEEAIVENTKHEETVGKLEESQVKVAELEEHIVGLDAHIAELDAYIDQITEGSEEEEDDSQQEDSKPEPKLAGYRQVEGITPEDLGL